MPMRRFAKKAREEGGILDEYFMNRVIERFSDETRSDAGFRLMRVAELGAGICAVRFGLVLPESSEAVIRLETVFDPGRYFVTDEEGDYGIPAPLCVITRRANDLPLGRIPYPGDPTDDDWVMKYWAQTQVFPRPTGWASQSMAVREFDSEPAIFPSY